MQQVWRTKLITWWNPRRSLVHKSLETKLMTWWQLAGGDALAVVMAKASSDFQNYVTYCMSPIVRLLFKNCFISIYGLGYHAARGCSAAARAAPQNTFTMLCINVFKGAYIRDLLELL
jgi:hypothetical protein